MRKYSMKPVCFLLFLCGVFTSCVTQGKKVQQEELSQYVEPRIGTAHCRWFHFTPGAMPFGMAKPAPSTNGHIGNKSGWEATGYDYRDQSIEGFPCLHEFQIGGIVLMPTTGSLKTIPGAVDDSTGRDRYRRLLFRSPKRLLDPGGAYRYPSCRYPALYVSGRGG